MVALSRVHQFPSAPRRCAGVAAGAGAGGANVAVAFGARAAGKMDSRGSPVGGFEPPGAAGD